MKSKMFGTLAAGAAAGLLVSGMALADNHAKGDHGKCVAASCKGSVTGATNACKGHDACADKSKFDTKAKCTAAKGSWVEPKAEEKKK